MMTFPACSHTDSPTELAASWSAVERKCKVPVAPEVSLGQTSVHVSKDKCGCQKTVNQKKKYLREKSL